MTTNQQPSPEAVLKHGREVLDDSARVLAYSDLVIRLVAKNEQVNRGKTCKQE